MFTFPENMVHLFFRREDSICLSCPCYYHYNFLSPLRHKEAQQYKKISLVTETGYWITPTLAPFHQEKSHVWLFLGYWKLTKILFHLSLNTILPQLIISSKESCKVISEKIQHITYLMQHFYGAQKGLWKINKACSLVFKSSCY